MRDWIAKGLFYRHLKGRATEYNISAFMITAKFSFSQTLEQLMRDSCNRTKFNDLAK